MDEKENKNLCCEPFLGTMDGNTLISGNTWFPHREIPVWAHVSMEFSVLKNEQHVNQYFSLENMVFVFLVFNYQNYYCFSKDLSKISIFDLEMVRNVTLLLFLWEPCVYGEGVLEGFRDLWGKHCNGCERWIILKKLVMGEGNLFWIFWLYMTKDLSWLLQMDTSPYRFNFCVDNQNSIFICTVLDMHFYVQPSISLGR